MAVALGIASLLAQLLSFVGMGFLIVDLAGLPRIFFPDGDWTASGLLPHVLETTISYWTIFLLSAAGATVAAWLMISARYRAPWFLGFCRVVGWLWMPFLPIGPVFGIMLLRARVYALAN